MRNYNELKLKLNFSISNLLRKCLLVIDATCEDLEPFLNGMINGNQTYGSTVVYECDIGYELIGQSVRKCRSDLFWNGTAPICTGWIIVNFCIVNKYLFYSSNPELKV